MRPDNTPARRLTLPSPSCRDAPVAVVTADCAPVVLVDDAGGSVGVAHAGWRGLHQGVLAATVATMRQNGGGSIRAALGPCIHAECYEFSGPDLDVVAQRFGPSVRGHDQQRRAGPDMLAAVRAALDELAVELVEVDDTCTVVQAGPLVASRPRQDEQRQATVAWLV